MDFMDDLDSIEQSLAKSAFNRGLEDSVAAGVSEGINTAMRDSYEHVFELGMAYGYARALLASEKSDSAKKKAAGLVQIVDSLRIYENSEKPDYTEKVNAVRAKYKSLVGSAVSQEGLSVLSF